MEDPAFASRQTTTVTSNTTVQTNIRFDANYIKTLPGILKCVQAICNLLGFIFIQASGLYAYYSEGSAFSTISMIGFWCTLFLLVLYVLHLIEKFYKLPWLKIEMIYCLVMFCLLLIVSSVAINIHHSFYKVAAAFGFISMLAYGLDTFLKFQAHRNGELAQGERVVTKTTTTNY